MAGFLNPGLGFASTVGSFIGGAAKQASANIEAANAQHAQDEKIWIAKFAKSMEDYEKSEDDRRKTNGVYQAARDLLRGNGKAADAVVRLWQANPKADVGELVERVKSGSQNLGPDSGYQSSVLNDLDASLGRRYQGLQNIRQNMRPNMQRMFPMPQEPTQYGNPSGTIGTGGNSSNSPGSSMSTANRPQIGNPNNIKSQGYEFSPGGTQVIKEPGMATTDLGGDYSGGTPNTQVAQNNNGQTVLGIGGMNKSLVGAEFTRIMGQGFKDEDGRKRFINSYNKAPYSPQSWDTSGVARPIQKLDPSMGPVMQDVTKALPYIDDPKTKQTVIDSIREAQQAGDASKIRYDLIPTREQMAEKDNTLAAGKEAGKKYVDDLEKRGTTIGANRALSFAADRIINTVTNPSGPLQASSLQPMLDEVNRFFGAAGVDLRSLGLPANRIEDVNMLKKVLGDMTFQQISQYHLGRWTNYEVGLLKQKLPSIDTSPVNMVQVALLFKNAADKEISTYVKEHELAYGPNGEYLFNPRNLGQAKMAGAKALQEGKVPWLEVSNYNNPTKNDEDTWSKIPAGTWVEDKTTGSMILKLENNNVKIVPNQVGAR